MDMINQSLLGFAVHGGTDGYSRRILWLEVGCTNNNSKIIANYFTDCIRQIGRVPRIVRAYAATKNMQVWNRYDFLGLEVKLLSAWKVGEQIRE